MKMVVVGGNSRDIGKTAVVAGLIRALPQYPWTAVKLTLYGSEDLSVERGESASASLDSPFSILEETDRSGETDTSRFLVAGARRALWVRAWREKLQTAIPVLRQAIAGDAYVILESNSILRFYRPNVYLVVLDPAREDFKASACEFLGQADASLVLEPGLAHPAWQGVPSELLRARPTFPIRRDCSVTPEIAAFVEKQLGTTRSAAPLGE